MCDRFAVHHTFFRRILWCYANYVVEKKIKDKRMLSTQIRAFKVIARKPGQKRYIVLFLQNNLFPFEIDLIVIRQR